MAEAESLVQAKERIRQSNWYSCDSLAIVREKQDKTSKNKVLDRHRNNKKKKRGSRKREKDSFSLSNIKRIFLFRILTTESKKKSVFCILFEYSVCWTGNFFYEGPGEANTKKHLAKKQGEEREREAKGTRNRLPVEIHRLHFPKRLRFAPLGTLCN